MLVGELIIIVIYPHFQAPALYIHNYYDTIYTGLLLISLLLHVFTLLNLELSIFYALATASIFSILSNIFFFHVFFYTLQ